MLLVLFSGCDKGNSSSTANADRTLLFGTYYGECIGEQCVEIFKLTDSQLFEDIEDSYAGQGSFSFFPLSNEQFEKAKGLRSAIPQELLSQPDSTFGCPDCVDQGGVFIQVITDGNPQTWRVDQNLSQVPAYLHSFVNQINTTVDAINE